MRGHDVLHPGATTSPRRPSEASQPPEHRRRRPVVRTNRIGLYGLLVVAALISLFPVFWLLSGSLQTREELYAGQTLVPPAPAWQNYLDAWVDGNLFVYLSNSIMYTAVSVAGILVVSSLAGYALARLDFAGKGLVTIVLLAVMIIPAPAMFIAQYKLLISFGLTDSRVGYVLVLITAGIPMASLIMRSFFVSQPRELEEAASIDGAGPVRTFFSVIMPLARPGLAAVGVIQGLQVWNEYLMALVLFADDSRMPVQRGLMSFVSSETPEQTILLAATAISVVPVIVFYLLAQRQIIAGLGAGAVK
ncbi:carbohydrate ABC transporter permease [Phytoactinopolyspora endophytica]|uniref:carbohydrate ABC transporter permease n=1 Tax=Phytoactinopolyspora endophytica TaxID=1642495 RepID=UPI00101D4C39|nr:carbohydrate ABC transporter permease [Phytoactinopolyspora endophytica]